MPSPRSLDQLRASVRTETDAVNDPHISDDELRDWLNRGIRVYFGLIQEADPDRLVVESTITTTSQVLEYALPADFYAIRGIDDTRGGFTRSLRSFSFEERNRIRATAGTASGADTPRFAVVGSGTDGQGVRLRFDRDPGSRTYGLFYIAVPVELVDPTDTVDDVMGLADYLVAYAALRVRKKRDEPTQDEQLELARVAEQIGAHARERISSGVKKPPRVRRRRHDLNPMKW